ncbi:ER membrane protein complex subunit 7 [Plakobranchus ocellatus]|uniref:ER membrane protein complex subunit 7 n=1 Tax=Plakobranchus ocellatus TaxID=259542 RepID=A0AAV3YJR4_9GAST|nr:ER membrane protein complex subunit 7 [Plakobranchus ocellatus]
MEEPIQFLQFILCMFLFNWNSFACGSDIDELNERNEFKIEGKVYVAAKDKEWTLNSRVLVDGGEYLGFVRSDGSFVVHGVPSGSYIVEIANPNVLFEALRVDITSKGKMRARRVNFLQPNQVKAVSYPLEFRERGKPNYFHKREQWRITDFLFNPMVLTMVVPLLLIMVLPKLMNAADADTQKEMQNQMNALNNRPNVPDASEFLSSLFSGGAQPKKAVKAKTNSASKRK